jgi:ribosomal 50S subunit-recycling heat shock protein
LRLDKYLQLTRLVKKREFTRELCREGLASANGLPAKPSRKVREGDVIELKLWNRHLTVRVVGCPRGNVPRREAALYYEVLEDKKVEEDLFGP